MNPNQELYAKSLEIAALMLGKTKMTGNFDTAKFQLMIIDYKNLAAVIAKHIAEPPSVIKALV